jgi:hypothetical protein
VREAPPFALDRPAQSNPAEQLGTFVLSIFSAISRAVAAELSYDLPVHGRQSRGPAFSAREKSMNRIFMGLALTAALAACGGGGDDPPSSTPANAAFPLAVAYKAYMSGPNIYSYGISGTCGGSASETTSPPVAATIIQGGPVLVKTTTMSMSWDGCLSISGMPPGSATVVSENFYDSSWRPLGVSIPAQGLTVVFTSGAAVPATVKVGDSAVVAGSTAASISFAVEADTETSVIVKLTTITTVNNVQTVETSSYRLTAAGALTLLRHEIFMPNSIHFVLTPK